MGCLRSCVNLLEGTGVCEVLRNLLGDTTTRKRGAVVEHKVIGFNPLPRVVLWSSSKVLLRQWIDNIFSYTGGLAQRDRGNYKFVSQHVNVIKDGELYKPVLVRTFFIDFGAGYGISK